MVNAVVGNIEEEEGEEEEVAVEEHVQELNLADVDEEEAVEEVPGHAPIPAFAEVMAQVAAAQAEVEEAEVAMSEYSRSGSGRKRKATQHKYAS